MDGDNESTQLHNQYNSEDYSKIQANSLKDTTEEVNNVINENGTAAENQTDHSSHLADTQVNNSDGTTPLVASGEQGVMETYPQEEKNNELTSNEAGVAEASTAAGVDSTNEEQPQEETELDKYWQAVKENPNDFTGWTYLLQYVEQENIIGPAAKAFDAFLLKYPYCYGYWKKYADLYKKHENIEMAEQVYKDGLVAIPLSTDLWLHYINFLRGREDGAITYEYMKGVYEEAINAGGTDFRSHRLWDHYINWETENKNLKKVTAIFDRVIQIPLQLYNYHYENFVKHINAHHPKEILELDEFLKLRKAVVSSKSDTPEVIAEKPPGADDAAPPGVEVDVPGSEVQETEADTHTTDEETQLLREKIIEIRKEVYASTEDQVSKRWAFEEGIRRPYFHVKALERSQLKNWEDYLEFEIENGTHERVIILYERCMIACALYENMWLKYARYLEAHSVEGVRNVFRRACEIHLPKKANLHLAYAAFEETQGNHERSIEIIKNFESNVSGLMSVRVWYINLLRRLGQYEKVNELYVKSIEETEDLSTKSAYACRYARYLSKVAKDTARARTILKEAVERDQTNTQLHMHLIDMEYQNPDLQEADMVAVFDRVIDNEEVELQDRVKFLQRKLEFVEDFGSDIKVVSKIEEAQQKLLDQYKDYSNKRKAEDQIDDNDAKKLKTDDSSLNGSAQAAAYGKDAGYGSMAATTDQSQYYNQWGNQQSYQNYNYQQGWQNYYSAQ